MNVYEIITERITTILEQGEIPWKKSWNASTQAPRNLSSGKLYSGINVFGQCPGENPRSLADLHVKVV